jgi:hypothetical protein
VENRLVSLTESIAYDPSGKRVAQGSSANGDVVVYFYGIGGQRLGTLWAGTHQVRRLAGREKARKAQKSKTENPGKKWPFASSRQIRGGIVQGGLPSLGKHH